MCGDVTLYPVLGSHQLTVLPLVSGALLAAPVCSTLRMRTIETSEILLLLSSSGCDITDICTKYSLCVCVLMCMLSRCIMLIHSVNIVNTLLGVTAGHCKWWMRINDNLDVDDF